MYIDRKALYLELEQKRGSKVLVYITGDRPGLETQIHPEVYDFFVNHLDRIGPTPKISLYLYTRGGVTLAAWSFVNLIKQFCDTFEVIIPSKAHSAGTLICLGANSIVMTKQATLGPIDPSVNTPLNPQVPGGAPDARVPVSVEAIKGFLELAQGELKIEGPENLTSVLTTLSEKIHPLVLGQVYRARSQIKMLARRLITGQIIEEETVDRGVNFLCSESGSHDYTIHRREARDELGLNIETPNDDLYNLIKIIYDDIDGELQFTSKFDPNMVLGGQQQVTYGFKRALIESNQAGSHYFISEGILTKQQAQTQPGIVQITLQDQRTFEGWRHENP